MDSQNEEGKGLKVNKEIVEKQIKEIKVGIKMIIGSIFGAIISWLLFAFLGFFIFDRNFLAGIFVGLLSMPFGMFIMGLVVLFREKEKRNKEEQP